MPKETISRELLEILACPVCKDGLKLKGNELSCVKCDRRYPLVDGIPHLLPPELMPSKKKT
jgi:hypothetical protein